MKHQNLCIRRLIMMFTMIRAGTCATSRRDKVDCIDDDQYQANSLVPQKQKDAPCTYQFEVLYTAEGSIDAEEAIKRFKLAYDLSILEKTMTVITISDIDDSGVCDYDARFSLFVNDILQQINQDKNCESFTSTIFTVDKIVQPHVNNTSEATAEQQKDIETEINRLVATLIPNIALAAVKDMLFADFRFFISEFARKKLQTKQPDFTLDTAYLREFCIKLKNKLMQSFLHACNHDSSFWHYAGKESIIGVLDSEIRKYENSSGIRLQLAHRRFLLDKFENLIRNERKKILNECMGMLRLEFEQLMATDDYEEVFKKFFECACEQLIVLSQSDIACSWQKERCEEIYFDYLNNLHKDQIIMDEYNKLFDKIMSNIKQKVEKQENVLHDEQAATNEDFLLVRRCIREYMPRLDSHIENANVFIIYKKKQSKLSDNIMVSTDDQSLQCDSIVYAIKPYTGRYIDKHLVSETEAYTSIPNTSSSTDLSDLGTNQKKKYFYEHVGVRPQKEQYIKCIQDRSSVCQRDSKMCVQSPLLSKDDNLCDQMIIINPLLGQMKRGFDYIEIKAFAESAVDIIKKQKIESNERSKK